MTTVSTARQQVERPTAIVAAVALALINGVGGVIHSAAWPDLDDRGTMVTVSIIAGALRSARTDARSGAGGIAFRPSAETLRSALNQPCGWHVLWT